jgi:DnaJ-domain-containing protein 1
MTSQDDPRRAIARLAVAVVIADGRVGADEIIALDELDLLGLGQLSLTAHEEMARAVVEPVDVAGTCARLAGLGPNTSAIIFTVLAHLAASDGSVSDGERRVLDAIAHGLGVPPADAGRILRAATAAGAAPPAEPSMPSEPRARSAHACRLLGIEPDASADGLAAAYLAAVERYDPATVAALGPEFVVLAVRKLVELTDAFEEARAAS